MSTADNQENVVNRSLLAELDQIAQIARHEDDWIPGHRMVDLDVVDRARALVRDNPSLPETMSVEVFRETGEIRLIVDPPRTRPKIAMENGAARLQEGAASTRLEAVLVIGGETILVRNGRAPGSLFIGDLFTAQDHFDDATIVRFLTEGLLPKEKN